MRLEAASVVAAKIRKTVADAHVIRVYDGPRGYILMVTLAGRTNEIRSAADWNRTKREITRKAVA